MDYFARKTMMRCPEARTVIRKKIRRAFGGVEREKLTVFGDTTRGLDGDESLA